MDWELSFKESASEKQEVEDLDYSKKQINSLGISKNEFKEFMENWKTKNL